MIDLPPCQKSIFSTYTLVDKLYKISLIPWTTQLRLGSIIITQLFSKFDNVSFKPQRGLYF